MFLVISIILTGISLFSLLWAAFQPAARRRFAAGRHGRHILLHALWPWVQAFRPLCEPLVSWRMRAFLAHRMSLAAFDPVWKPADLVALQLVVFTGSAIVVIGGLHMWTSLSLEHALLLALLISMACAWVPWHVIRGAGVQRQQQMLRELPFLLDMTTLCVEAGLNLQGALERAARHGPAGPLRQEFRHALAEIRAGTPRMEALENLAARVDLNAVASLVSALKQADQTGSSLGLILRSQADQRRSEQFLRAEELALKAPVKMLFPMVVFIFPCTFLVIGFPVAVKVFSGAW